MCCGQKRSELRNKMTRLASHDVTRTVASTNLNSEPSTTTRRQPEPTASPAAAQPKARTFGATGHQGRIAFANSAGSSFVSPNADLQNSVATNRPSVQSAATVFQSDNAAVSLRYTESSPIRVRGPVTGRNYEFSAANPIQFVDSRDACLLLNARFFRSL
jgi:cytoskeletal protein RodZ